MKNSPKIKSLGRAVGDKTGSLDSVDVGQIGLPFYSYAGKITHTRYGENTDRTVFDESFIFRARDTDMAFDFTGTVQLLGYATEPFTYVMLEELPNHPGAKGW